MSDLTGARDHYRKMADPNRTPDIPDTERRLWAHLADEIDAYLEAQASPLPVDDEALW